MSLFLKPDLSSESNASSETSELASSYIASKEKEHEELQNHKIGIVLEDLKVIRYFCCLLEFLYTGY